MLLAVFVVWWEFSDSVQEGLIVPETPSRVLKEVDIPYNV